MIFHKPLKDSIEDPYRNYEVLCGIEEEFFIINESGTLVEAADDLMKTAANLLERDNELLNSLKIKIRSLDAEPSPSQIEYVTLPLPPEDLNDAIKLGRRLLTSAADDLGVKIFAQSLHPIQSNPNPIVGTHINVSIHQKGNVMKPKELRAVYNYFWNYLPELIAMSANSPIYQGKLTGNASNRYVHSNVLKPNNFARFKQPEKGPALVQMQYYGRLRYNLRIGSGEDEFAKSVIANERGARLVDISPRGPSTNIGDDKDDSPSRNRVEIRIIDVQQEIKDLLDVAYLCCSSAFHAIYLNETGKITKDPYHKYNMENAIRNGYSAVFKRESMNESLEESLSRWIEDIEKYLEHIGMKLQALPREKLMRDLIQKEIDITFETKEIEEFRRRGRNYAEIRIGTDKIISDNRGNKYKVQKGAQIHGNLSSKFDLKYREKDNLVINFENLKVINVLEVQGLEIPLDNNDKIMNTLSESDYLMRRLFGNFF